MFSDKFKEIYELRNELDKESDRGCALLSVSFLEEELKDALNHFLIKDSPVTEKVFQHNGSLSTFSSKIDMSYLLGLISKKTHKDLNIIRNIRNDFAHSKFTIDFNNEKIKNRCSNLKSHYRNLNEGTRKIFITTVYGLLAKIVTIHSEVKTLTEKIEDDKFNEYLKENTKQKVQKMNEYYEMLELIYKDHPNKEKLIKEDIEEYANDLKTAYLEILKKMESKK